MTQGQSIKYLNSIFQEMCKLSKETEWLEFKQNKADPEEIGEYISALSNSAALNGKTKAYILWGVNDKTHEVVGTTFLPHKTKIQNEELENWLLHLIQ